MNEKCSIIGVWIGGAQVGDFLSHLWSHRPTTCNAANHSQKRAPPAYFSLYENDTIAVAKIEAQLNELRHKLTTGIASGWADSSNTTATYKQKLEGAQRAINFVADGDFPKVKESLAEALRLKVTVDRLKGNMEDAAHNRKQSLVHLEDATKNLNIIANNMERGGSSSGRIGENVKWVVIVILVVLPVK